MGRASPPTYWDYLDLERLLALQNGLEADDAHLPTDELHFIIVHQVFELWFKLALRELRLARDWLAAPRVAEETVPQVVHHLKRVHEILRLATDQFRVMETLTPQDFLGFRDKLVPASGFQSFQMREIEFVLGLDDAQRLQSGGVDPLEHIRKAAAASPAGQAAWARLAAARRETTLRSALDDWLYRTPIQGSSPEDAADTAVVDAFLAEYLQAYAALLERQTRALVQSGVGTAAALQARAGVDLQRATAFVRAADVDEGSRARRQRIRAGVLFVESYRELPLLAWPRLLVDSVVEMEEMFVLWRTRHARMVERIIGRRQGTGGSPGVDYLDQTLQYRIFTDLWSVRTLLVPRAALPALGNPAFYGFAT